VFQERFEELPADQMARGETETSAKNIVTNKNWDKENFYIPEQSRWDFLLNEAHQNVGDYLKRALSGLEEHNAGGAHRLHPQGGCQPSCRTASYGTTQQRRVANSPNQGAAADA